MIKKPDRVAYKDVQVLSKVWIDTIKMVNIKMIENEKRSYKRGIKSLISTLFKEERLQAQQKLYSYNDKNIDAYRETLEYIIDMLEDKGYLKYKSIDVIETHEGDDYE